MDLAPDQHFVYAWRYKNDTACKLGVSTPRVFYARIKAAKTVTWRKIELLGIEVFESQAAARAAYQHRLNMFPRVAERRAWVHLNDAVWEWLKTECLSNPPSLEAFKVAFLEDPVRREKERGYQHRASQKRAVKRRQRASGRTSKRTEKQRAYEREYARKQRQNNPEYNQRRKKSWRKWKQKNPDYEQKRYAEDPEYREKRKAARRKRYAEDPEYREQQKTRYNAWKQQHPNYRQRRAAYMREWRKNNPDYDKKRYRAKGDAEGE